MKWLRAIARRWAWLLGAMLLALGALATWIALTANGRLIAVKPSHLIRDRRGRYLGEVPTADGLFGYWPLPAEIPKHVLRATLEAEDRHFYEHPGVYLPSVFRAAEQDLRAMHVVSGASTLAMQVARMQDGPGGRTVWRKAREAVEALLLVHRYGHDRVLRQYLKLAPYGHRVRGIARAARMYFDEPVADLSWLQAAFLVGLPQSPGRMDPWDARGRARGLRRAHQILRALHHDGFITRVELRQALSADLDLVPEPHRDPAALHATLAWSALASKRTELISTATLDLELQDRVAKVLADNLRRLRPEGAGNTAALVVDSKTGDILAYVGSSDYFDARGHGAIDYVQTRRSPGSTLKPFIYGLGLQQGWLTAASLLPDVPLALPLGGGDTWVPENVSGTFLGPMRARQALANSRNIPALRVLSKVGVERALELFSKGGVKQIDWTPGAYGLGLAIGNLPVTLEELVGLYGMLANEGETLPLRHFLHEQSRPRTRLLHRDVAQMVRNILSDPLARRPSFPSDGPLTYPYAVAVKTGTSQGYRDAWTVGFSDRLIVGVWVGSPDWQPMNHVGGFSGASKAVHEIFDVAMPMVRPYQPVTPRFPFPDGYVTRNICTLSGQLAGPYCPSHRVEAFPKGRAPKKRGGFHHRVPIDWRNGLRAGPSCPKRFVTWRVMLDLPEIYQRWARAQHLEVAPTRLSPLCPGVSRAKPLVTITEPKNRARFLYDPDTPSRFSTVRLAADVSPSTGEVVWIVDGVPKAEVGWPYEYLWPLTPGKHTIVAALAHRDESSRPISVTVGN